MATTTSETELAKEIVRLKIERNAVILAHYYQSSEIQDIADAIGDSLYLAQKGFSLPHKTIVLAGVVFMAESVKILSPHKTVLVPDLGAGCSLVEDTPSDKFADWVNSYSNSVVVTYVNSSAEVKALSDIICTSSNAEKIIRCIPEDKTILFGPDRNLGRYLERKVGRPLVLWPGACEVHVLFSAQKMYEMKRSHPQALVVAHPECDESVLAYADFVGSTSALLDEVSKSSRNHFIVATEEGILHQMKMRRPDAEFLQAPTSDHCACNQCPYMKLNSLEKIRDSLRDLTPAIEVAEGVRIRALRPLQRMLDVSAGRSVNFKTGSALPFTSIVSK